TCSTCQPTSRAVPSLVLATTTKWGVFTSSQRRSAAADGLAAATAAATTAAGNPGRMHRVMASLARSDERRKLRDLTTNLLLFVAKEEGDADGAAGRAEEALVEAHEPVGDPYRRRLHACRAGMEPHERAQQAHPVHLEQVHEVLGEVERVEDAEVLLREPRAGLVLVDEPEVPVGPGPDGGVPAELVQQPVDGVVEQREPQGGSRHDDVAPRLAHAAHLPHRLPAVLDVLDDVHAEDGVEEVGGIGEGLRVLYGVDDAGLVPVQLLRVLDVADVDVAGVELAAVALDHVVVFALAGAEVEGARNGPAGGEALEEPLDEEVAGAVGGHQQLQVDARGENQGGSQPITDDTTAATRAWYGPAAPWPPLPSGITSLWPCCWAPRCEPRSGRRRCARRWMATPRSSASWRGISGGARRCGASPTAPRSRPGSRRRCWRRWEPGPRPCG